jgi:cytochrome c peroxidase
LFFSRTLSGTGDVGCVTCHHPFLAGADGLSLSVGVQSDDPLLLGPGRRIYPNASMDAVAGDGPNVPRNAPTTFNSVFYSRAMFHDGRLFVLSSAHSPNGAGQVMRTPDSIQNLPDLNAGPNMMATQANFPVTSLFEMRGYGEFVAENNPSVREKIEQRLQASSGWIQAFRDAFAEPAAPVAELVTYDNVALALGEYQRSQVFIDSPWNDYVNGNESALSDAAKRGAVLFFRPKEEGGLGCAACHGGAHFTTEEFFVSGFPQIGRGKNTAQQDFGRRDVTQNDDDRYRFRVPSLLNVARTAPYGHAGTFDTLEATIRYHVDPEQGAAGFDYTLQDLKQYQGLTVRYPNAQRNAQLAAAAFMASDSKPLLYKPDLSDQELGYVVAFLEALTDPCLDSLVCLDPWVAKDATDNPDGAMLDPCFASDVVPGFACAPGGGGGVASGSTGTGSGGPAPAADDPAGVVDVSAQADMVTARGACPNGLGSVSNAGELRFAKVAAATSGLTHSHGFSNSTWQASTPRDDDLLIGAALGVGDLNGDCWEDVLFAAGDNGLQAYLGQAGGNFAAQPSGGARNVSVAVADLDGDYRPDIVIGGMVSPGAKTKVSVLRNDWPAFEERTETQSNLLVNRSVGNITVGDYNLDGWPDLFFGMWTAVFNIPPEPHLWRGLGDLEFHPAGPSGLTNVLDFTFAGNIADLNNDGRPDLAITGDFENSHVYLQTETGTGTFQKTTDRTVISDENGMGAAVADFDNDGDLDWFVSSIYSDQPKTENGNYGVTGNRFYRNPGNGQFVDDTDNAGVRDGGWGWGSCAADFDNDGDLDIFQAEGYGYTDEIWDLLYPDGGDDPWPYFHGTPARLFINDGTGRFEEQAAAWEVDDRDGGRGISCLDSDRDGDIDLLIANHSRQPSYYLNQAGAGSGRHFLAVRLVGIAPNTEALGARIYVTANGKTQMREISNGGNYMGNNPLEQHFGLGGATTADIRVVWTRTNEESVLDDVPVNQFLVIGEP